MSLFSRTSIVITTTVMLFGGIIQVSRSPALSHSHVQKPSPWSRYTVNNEEFSVLLPIAPAMTTSEVYVDEKTGRRERVLGAYSDGVVYAIYTFEKKSLSLDEVARRFEVDQQAERVALNGVDGMRSRFENEDRIGITEVFATAANLYVFEAAGSKLVDPAPGISMFFSSISFGKNPEGQKIVDGPGDLPAANPDNSQSTVFSGKQVTTKVKVFTKPEPRYTDEARRNQITGTVILRTVFSSSGAVTNIRAVSTLPDGLTERAIGAAKQIKFIPAIKDGRFVSMWMELQYNFNLY